MYARGISRISPISYCILPIFLDWKSVPTSTDDIFEQKEGRRW